MTTKKKVIIAVCAVVVLIVVFVVLLNLFLDGFGKELLGVYAALEARHPGSSYVSLFRPIAAVLGLVPDQRLPAKRLGQVQVGERILGKGGKCF